MSSILPWLSLALGAPLTVALLQDPEPPAAAKPADVESIDALVNALYDVISGPAGQKRDWDRMRSLFHHKAHLIPLVPRGDGVAAVHMTVDDYVQRAGASLEKSGFFEQEIHRHVDRFGDLAQVFSTYEGRRKTDDEEPFLRGINSIQLCREAGRWWILSIAWEQEHDAGPIPGTFLPDRK